MNYLKPNQKRAKNAITLIWIVFAMEIIAFISGYFQFDLLQHAADGAKVSMETANANDKREQIIGIAYLIVYVTSAVTFILWFRRAYFNLGQQTGSLTHTDVWATIGWFVPFANLYVPYRIMKEIYQKTNYLLKDSMVNVASKLSTSSLGLWWTLWIINNLIGQFVFRYSLKAESIEELTISTIVAMIGNVVGIPLALITVNIIKRYAAVEPLLYELNSEQENIHEQINETDDGTR